MNIILDNIIFSLQHTGGISVVWQQHLRRIAAEKNVHLTYLEYPNANIQRAALPIKAETRPYRLLERYRIPDIQVEGPAIFHSSYFRILPIAGVRNITTIHDLTYHYYRHGLARAVHLWEEERALRHSEAIICISDNTRSDLLRCYPWLDENRIHVVYNGVSEVYRPTQTTTPTTPFSIGEFLLYVGNRTAAYKRYHAAVAVARETQRPLVIVGSALSPAEQTYLCKQLGEGHYHSIVNANAEQINSLYNQALALLYPSDYEGFGLPIVEAQRAGCPVIAQSISSIPEIAGGAALLVPHQTDIVMAMSEQVRALMSGQIRRNQLLQHGLQNAQRFDWQQTYQQTMNIYRNIINQ